ncbi:MAG TPA: tetratricopeptide repeat protein [Albitalea sp.]|nr:tetratricopeptide repeat protein [Albitalea sp.]
MYRWACWLLCLCLAACASAPTAPRADYLLHDELFAPASERIDARDVFALSDAMKHYLRHEISAQLRSEGRQRGLVQALYQRGQLKLEYDAARTRNAAQAFEARAGNCLSLVIMTAAFAKELDLTVDYQSAFLEETWSRAGDFYLRSGHVNLTLGRRLADAGTGDTISLTIDFLPAEELRGLRTRHIDEATVVAMYMNNRSAEALVQGKVDDAYWWAREAIAQDPGFVSAYNTLGVVYLHHGDLPAARQVLAHVLQREPDNTRAMFNLAQVFRAEGRLADATRLEQRVAQLEPDPPFHFFNLGMAAMQRADYRTARDLFAKEVARADYYHEFHYWLGVANYRLGDLDQARKQLALAMENSVTHHDHDLYAAKLAWLKSTRHQ